MKKYCLPIILTIIFIFNLYSKEKVDSMVFWAKDKVPCYIYNDTLKRMDERELTIYIKANTEYKIKFKKYTGNIIQLYFNDVLNRNCIEILPEQRAQFLEIIKKYKEWNEKALSEKVTLEKDIDHFNYDLSWKSIYGDDWYSSYNNTIYFKFFSQNEKLHQFVIYFSKAKSSSNEYIDNKPETLYLNYDQVLLLEKYLSDEYINEQIDIAKKEKEKENMFQ